MKKVYFAHDRQESPEERKSYLELTGYHVQLFSNAGKLLEACRAEPPELVLLDALLPGQNGFATAAAIRGLLGPVVPIVLCSRIYKAEAFRQEAKRVGCDGYLQLPVQMGEFLACVQNVTQLARNRAAEPAESSEAA